MPPGAVPGANWYGMADWPATARVEAREDVTREPPADRTTVGEDAGVADQVDRATAPRRVRQIRFLCQTDADAAAWIVWAIEHGHRWFTGLPGVAAGARWRLVNGLGGATLTPFNAGGGRRGWAGEATVESPDP